MFAEQAFKKIRSRSGLYPSVKIRAGGPAIRGNYSRSVLFDLKSGLARARGVGPGRPGGRSRWHSRSYCHEEITCVMRREWDSRPASGHRIIDITTKAACAVTLKIDWTMYPVVDKATSCYTCPWIYALVHHCDESKRKSQILRFSVGAAEWNRMQMEIAIEKSRSRSFRLSST